MDANDDVAASNRTSLFMRAAGWIGDLGNPFYAEERQRDVWNEASAVGLQVVLWLGIIAATVMIWVQGQAALPYAVTMFAVLGAASLIAVSYAKGLGVRVEDPVRMNRLRLLPYGALLVLFLVGAMRAAPTSGDGFGRGFTHGLAIGGAAAVLWLLWSTLRARRNVRDRN